MKLKVFTEYYTDKNVLTEGVKAWSLYVTDYPGPNNAESILSTKNSLGEAAIYFSSLGNNKYKTIEGFYMIIEYG